MCCECSSFSTIITLDTPFQSSRYPLNALWSIPQAVGSRSPFSWKCGGWVTAIAAIRTGRAEDGHCIARGLATQVQSESKQPRVRG